jgi:hypothetical protein
MEGITMNEQTKAEKKQKRLEKRAETRIGSYQAQMRLHFALGGESYNSEQGCPEIDDLDFGIWPPHDIEGEIGDVSLSPDGVCPCNINELAEKRLEFERRMIGVNKDNPDSRFCASAEPDYDDERPDFD